MYLTIVTPIFNGSRFLDETILSVVTQAGDFRIRYHVQDAGSTDDTVSKLQDWASRLRNGFPLLCQGIEFTYASEPDLGLYDGINRAFAACEPGQIMAWINADDRFAPGAFVAAAQIFEQFPDVHWLTGRATAIDEAGAILALFPFMPLPRRAVAAAIFEGRYASSFIQQEGTFWRPWLWREVRGIDHRFRLAGDFDLWRRMAKHADLVSACDTILGFWRRRVGQLSGNRGSYLAEIDRSLTPQETELQQGIAAKFDTAILRGTLAQDGYAYPIVYRPGLGEWTYELRGYHPSTPTAQAV
jgi:glycosyltransferase involved in cell wall biosynthesis